MYTLLEFNYLAVTVNEEKGQALSFGEICHETGDIYHETASESV
jgi:hypothetical protein